MDICIFLPILFDSVSHGIKRFFFNGEKMALKKKNIPTMANLVVEYIFCQLMIEWKLILP